MSTVKETIFCKRVSRKGFILQNTRIILRSLLIIGTPYHSCERGTFFKWKGVLDHGDVGASLDGPSSSRVLSLSKRPGPDRDALVCIPIRWKCLYAWARVRTLTENKESHTEREKRCPLDTCSLFLTRDHELSLITTFLSPTPISFFLPLLLSEDHSNDRALCACMYVFRGDSVLQAIFLQKLGENSLLFNGPYF